MYHNFGDKDFFEYGMLVDDEHSDTVFDILFCFPYSDAEDLYQFGHCSVDISDDWINKDAVKSYAGCKEDDPVQFAIACLEYYGAENFGVESYGVFYDWGHMDRKSVLKELKGYLIAWDEVTVDAA